MIRSLLRWLVATSVVAILAATPVLSHAQTGGAGSAATPAPAKPKRDWYPFFGSVVAIDKQAMTISLKKKEGERIVKVDTKSVLEFDGKRGVVADVKVGHYIHGKMRKDAAGKEVIVEAKFEKERPKRPPQPSDSSKSNAPN